MDLNYLWGFGMRAMVFSNRFTHFLFFGFLYFQLLLFQFFSCLF